MEFGKLSVLGDREKNKKGEYITIDNYPESLVYFSGKGHYSPPEFIWGKTVFQLHCYFLILIN